MMKFVMTLIPLFVVVSSFSARADEAMCTAWIQQSGESCLFAGQSANIYKRQCGDSCGENCISEYACAFENPQSFEGGCSTWHKWVGSTCQNRNSNSWEQKWERSCGTGVNEIWCSKEYPSF